MEAALGWAIREGVTNVIRHSRAAHCRIALVREDGLVRAEVVDDGVGGDAATEAGPGPGRGFRLTVAAPAGGAAMSRDGAA